MTATELKPCAGRATSSASVSWSVAASIIRRQDATVSRIASSQIVAFEVSMFEPDIVQEHQVAMIDDPQPSVNRSPAGLPDRGPFMVRTHVSMVGATGVKSPLDKF